MRTLRIDIYADMDETDINKPLSIDVGEVRDLETGVIYTGKITISDLTPVGSSENNPFEEE